MPSFPVGNAVFQRTSLIVGRASPDNRRMPMQCVPMSHLSPALLLLEEPSSGVASFAPVLEALYRVHRTSRRPYPREIELMVNCDLAILATRELRPSHLAWVASMRYDRVHQRIIVLAAQPDAAKLTLPLVHCGADLVMCGALDESELVARIGALLRRAPGLRARARARTINPSTAVARIA
jgi:DNA-binding response OmpR family regulator